METNQTKPEVTTASAASVKSSYSNALAGVTLKEYDGSYRSKNGTPTFKYLVGGTKEGLAAYVKAQGANVRYKNDNPEEGVLFFTTTPQEVGSELILTQSGRVSVVQDLLGIALEEQMLLRKAKANKIAEMELAGISRQKYQQAMAAKFVTEDV